MKTLLNYITIIIIAAALFSCEKDDKDTQPTATIDPCTNVVCQNDGWCVNGGCNCIIGYTGDRCQKQKIPTSITIDTIAFGGYNDRTLTDPFDQKPELYVIVSRGSTILFTSRDNNFNDCEPDVLYYYHNVGMQVGAVETYTITLFDKDFSSSDDLITQFNTSFYEIDNGFPGVLYFDAGNGVIFAFSLTYNF